MSKEIMQQALTVLKAWDALIKYQYGGSSEAMTAMQNVAWRTLDTIEGLEAALAQHEQEPVAQIRIKNGYWIDTPRSAKVKSLPDGLHNLYTAPPKPEQAPDAWLSGEGLELKQVLVKQNGDWVETPFSIGQPRKEWVGLTGREIELVLINSGYTAENFARAIEAKLKEKNT
jgi:hypothetical protein